MTDYRTLEGEEFLEILMLMQLKESIFYNKYQSSIFELYNISGQIYRITHYANCDPVIQELVKS